MGRSHPLIDAAESGDQEAVTSWIQAGEDVNAQDTRKNDTLGLVIGGTAIRKAAAKGHVEIVKRLLEAGADPNLSDHYGWTPLLSACQAEHVEVVRLLVENGAQVDIPNALGVTALSLAAVLDNPEMVSILLSHGADPTLADEDGKTPQTQAEKWAGDAVKSLLGVPKK